MSLALNFDALVRVISEPGYYQRKSAGDLKPVLDPHDPALKFFWYIPGTDTLALRPFQLDYAWINTINQSDSIIGLVDRGAVTFLQANPADVTAKRIYEANRDQNLYNPWVFFAAPSPDNAQAPVGFIPATPGQLQGVRDQADMDLYTGIATFPMSAEGAALPPPGVPADARWLCSSVDPIEANAPLYFRWYEPKGAVGHLTSLFFFVGQYCLTIQRAVITISEDISARMDRTAWRRVGAYPLFAAVGEVDTESNIGYGAHVPPNEQDSVDRSLLWLPFGRHQVLLYSSLGYARIIRTRGFPLKNGQTGVNADWDITKSAKLEVWALSPSAGAFQIQRVKYPHHGSGGYGLRIPAFYLDYTPTDPLTADNIVPDLDKYHGTSFDWTAPVTPPGYDPPINKMDLCPTPLTDASDQRQVYGLNFFMDSNTTGRWTPFFYGYDIRVPPKNQNWTVSPLLFGDQPPATTRIKNARLTSSLDPDDCRLNCEVWDFPPLSAGGRYYRTDVPIELFETAGPVRYFIGLTDPNELYPLRWDAAAPRVLHLNARCLWKILKDTTLMDQRDWGPDLTHDPALPGKGHIFVVDFVAKQAGIDTSGADYAGGIGSAYDWHLGGDVATHTILTGKLNPPWKPKTKPPDTAERFIKRIAHLFSGWDVGFHPDGQFYYHPKDWYRHSEATFHLTQGSGTPVYYRQTVEFRAEPPELNALRVQSIDENGNSVISSWWVDFPSIKNPSAPNFVGRWKPGVIILDGAFTCTELNWIARKLWEAGRRRYLTCKFEAEWQPALKVGHCFTLEGQPGLFRLRDFSVEFRRVGWHRAQYEAEFVERGYL